MQTYTDLKLTMLNARKSYEWIIRQEQGYSLDADGDMNHFFS